MKKLLSILLLSFILIGCNDRVLENDLEQIYDSKIGGYVYYLEYDYHTKESTLFNGVGYTVHSNGQLESEFKCKDGKRIGLKKEWDENGQLEFEYNYNDGQIEGLKEWYVNGQLKEEKKFKGGELVGIKQWDENGQLDYEHTYDVNVQCESWRSKKAVEERVRSLGNRQLSIQRNSSDGCRHQWLVQFINKYGSSSYCAFTTDGSSGVVEIVDVTCN
tara:strand:- start:398 stop:1048 length:651 start_codon:yes stop_codon:yes gene_type:complete